MIGGVVATIFCEISIQDLILLRIILLNVRMYDDGNGDERCIDDIDLI